MLDLSYEESHTNKWRPRRGFRFRTFDLAGTSDDLDAFIAVINRVAMERSPSVTAMTEQDEAAWLVVARSDSDLELVHLDRGMLLTGNVESLQEVSTHAGYCSEQGKGDSPLDGYHTYVMAFDVHNLSRGRSRPNWIADLRIRLITAPTKPY